MATIAELMIKLGMDDGGLDKGMSSSQSKLKSWGESLGKLGDKLTTKLTLPLAAAGVMAIKWASDLDESLNKTGVLFGDAADDVIKYSEGSAKALGFSQQATLDYASAFAGMLNTVATTDTELADMSTTLTGLTSDFASFHNLNPAEAFTVIQSALAGETEAIRRYGVDVSAAAVETEALAMGLASTASELTEQDKLLARYSILLKSTSEEQGDFARTANSTSNQLKILRARIQDVGAQFGKFLLPYVNMAVDKLLDLIDVLEGLDPKWQKVILAVAAFAAILGPALILLGMMLPALGALATVIGILISPIGLLVLAIAALIGLGIYAWANDLWGVRDAVSAVIDAFVAFGQGLDAFRKYIQLVLSDGDLLNDWLTHFPEALQPIVVALGQVALALQNFWDMMGPVLADFGDALQALGEGDWREVLDELQEAFLGLGEAISVLSADVLQILADYFNDLADSAGRLEPTLSMLSQYFSTSADAMRDLSEAFSAALAGDWSGFFENLGYAALNLIKALGELNIAFGLLAIAIITALAEGLQNAWETTVMPWMQGRGAELLGEANNWALNMLQAGSDLVTGFLDGIMASWPLIEFWAGLVGPMILAQIGDLTTTLLQKGMDLLQGLMDGLANKWPAVSAWLALLPAVVLAAVPAMLRTLHSRGLDAIAGMWDGIKDKWAELKGWLSGFPSYIFLAVPDLSRILRSRGVDAISGMYDGVLDRWAALKSWLSGLGGYILSAVPDLSGTLIGVGWDLMAGLASGITGAASALVGAAIEYVAGLIPDWAKGFLGINSPAKVMIPIGESVSEGMALGISNGWSDFVMPSMDDALGQVSGVSPAMSGSTGTGFGNTYISISLKSQELIDLIRNAEDGGEFSRNFGAQLGLYGGRP